MFKPSLERKSIRLFDYDYSKGGLFFITICIHNHKCILGRIKDEEMLLSEFGRIVKEEWTELKNENVLLEEFTIMPNHIHAIVKLEEYELSRIIREFKSRTTVKYINNVKEKGWPRFEKRLWQRNYFEHIIRNEKSYHKIAEYIKENPFKWEEDKFHKD